MSLELLEESFGQGDALGELGPNRSAFFRFVEKECGIDDALVQQAGRARGLNAERQSAQGQPLGLFADGADVWPPGWNAEAGQPRP